LINKSEEKYARILTMPLARLENFLKNLNGNTLYVDPNELDASDSIENRGNSRLRPFKTIQRALLEAARFAYIPGTNNDLFDQTTILISPGTHFIDNRPGYWIDESNVIRDVNGAVRTISEFNISSNFDLTDPANQLYIYNSASGGVIVPKGTSIVASDLRKTKIRPKFVPDPVDDNIDPSAIFKVTGACYIYGFTIFDGDPLGKCYSNYTANSVTPTYSHHKLTAFEYADDTNNIFYNDVDTTHTDLDNYYYKLSLGYGAQSNRSILDGYANFQPNVDENRIVGELGSGSIIITSAISGNGVSGTNVITVQTASPHNLSPFTPIIVSGLAQDEGPVSELEYNGNFIVAQVTSTTEFTYLVSGVPSQTLNPSVTGATVKVISDTVSSASPYFFNLSLKSVYGMNGIHADGSKAKGFKSMVTAQFTGISLQKDDRAFAEYDEVSGSYKFQTNFGVDKFLHQSSRARYRPSWETCHIKASNNAFIQCVSIFAIGYAKQFITDTGGDQSITNSNSNFGQISLFSSGYKKDVLAKDNHAYITHIIQPKEINDKVNQIRYEKIDAPKTIALGPSNQNTKIYFKDYTDLLNPPRSNVRGFVVGAAKSEFINFKAANIEYSAPIANTFGVEYNIQAIDTVTNIITLVGLGSTGTDISGISTGISGRIVSKNGVLPDGIESNKLYNIRLSGDTGIKLYENIADATSDTNIVDIKNQVGLGFSNLSFVSRVSQKEPGDIGHPIQWDSTNQNWYVGVTTVGFGATYTTGFFNALALVSAPGSYVKRKLDSRPPKDKTYRVRIVIPKEAQSASDITSGFIIQRPSNSLSSLTFQSETADLVSGTSNELSFTRNKGAIIDAWYDTGTATIITSKPHNLKVGDPIKIYNLKSSAEPNPVGLGTGSGFNGEFTVASVVNELRFTYTITRDPGTISVGISTAQSWLTVRDCAQTSNYRIPPYTIYDANRSNLPYFTQTELSNDYQIYDVVKISQYQEGVTDGIYHATINAFKNVPNVSPFNVDSYKFSQNIERLYPSLDSDNPNSDPDAAITKASRKNIGTTELNDNKKSTTKETIASLLKDLNVAKSITGITTYQDTTIGGVGICTITTATNHGFGGISRLTISNAGSGYVNGTYYDIPLCGGAGADATCTVTVSGNVVTDVIISNFGSGYVVGNTVTARGIPGSSTSATFIVASTNTSATDADTVQILGCGNEGNNGTFIIKSFTSNTITCYNNSCVPESPEQGVITWGGPAYQLTTSSDGSVYSPVTNNTTITTQQPHHFEVGTKVIFDDQILTGGSIGICTVNNVLGITSFTVKGDAGSATRVYSYGFSPISKDTDKENENLASRHFALYSGFKSKTLQTITTTSINFLVSNLYGLQKGDVIQIGSEIMLVTKVSGGEIYVRRGIFGTKVQQHSNGTAIRRITSVPIETRRNSIIRASGHTFEYVGFGPGNYSTGMPTNQDRILTESEVLTSQSLVSQGGVVVYTGMNSNGEFYIGKTKFDAVTGNQTEVGAPIENEGEEATVDSLEVNNLTVNDLIDASTANVTLGDLTVESDSAFVGITTFQNNQPAVNTSLATVVVVGGVSIGDDLIVGNDAKIDNVTVGLTSATTIDTAADNLYLNSAGGTVNVTDHLGVSGNVKIAGIVTVTAPSTINGYGTIPLGGIIMWSGTIASIPTGWSLCNGSNGTPDLRNRFIIGASVDAVVGVTTATTTVTGSSTKTGGTKDAIVVSHSHTISGGSVTGTFLTSGSVSTSQQGRSSGGANAVTGVSFSSSSASPVYTEPSASTVGSSGTDQNLPPYYALAFIQRTF
jgi:hypothetical protein